MILRAFFAAAVVTILWLNSIAYAAIEKKAAVDPSNNQVHLYWWPKLSPPKGWHQDEKQSYYEGANVLAPDGSDFVKAETVMYAEALYKERIKKAKSLDQLIEGDVKFFASASTMQEEPDLVTADGKKIKVFSFYPRSEKGNWEKVGYGEEGDYYLIFAISSRSRSGLEKNKEDFEQMIKSYK